MIYSCWGEGNHADYFSLVFAVSFPMLTVCIEVGFLKRQKPPINIIFYKQTLDVHIETQAANYIRGENKHTC